MTQRKSRPKILASPNSDRPAECDDTTRLRRRLASIKATAPINRLRDAARVRLAVQACPAKQADPTLSAADLLACYREGAPTRVLSDDEFARMTREIAMRNGRRLP